MPRVKLKPGDDSIATSRKRRLDLPAGTSDEKQKGRGHWTMQWFICLEEGDVRRVKTEIKDGTKGELIKKANEKAEALRQGTPGDGVWKPTSSMSAFVRNEAIPSLEKNRTGKDGKPLADNSITRYVHVLELFAQQAKGLSIKAATSEAKLETLLQAIAATNGTASAKQALKVVSFYVMPALKKRACIKYNPLNDPDFRNHIVLPKHIAVAKPKGGQALLPADRRKVVDYLLALDPTCSKGVRGRYTAEQRTAKRKLIIDTTLLQATVGFRISEVRLLAREDVRLDGERVFLSVGADKSKTDKGREIEVLDPRVADMVRERLAQAAPEPSALLFPAPAAPGKVWDRTNAQKCIRAFYGELADALDIPLLREVRSHVWRTTLNSEFADLGVSAERRAAYFGHSEQVNRERYTDLVDMDAMARQVGNHLYK